MMIGYAPNAFEHSVRLLQILNNFGINKAIIWRRISNHNGEQSWICLAKFGTFHAQDNMAACCSDQVNQQIKTRYQEVEESVDQLINFYQRKISQGIKVGQQQWTQFIVTVAWCCN